MSLIRLEPSNLVAIRIEPGQKCYGELTLRNVMYTMPVAIRMLPVNKGRYTVSSSLPGSCPALGPLFTWSFLSNVLLLEVSNHQRFTDEGMMDKIKDMITGDKDDDKHKKDDHKHKERKEHKDEGMLDKIKDKIHGDDDRGCDRRRDNSHGRDSSRDREHHRDRDRDSDRESDRDSDGGHHHPLTTCHHLHNSTTPLLFASGERE
ncbi:hypothetical protein GOBAR_AA10585 [Gossypium barbadense]|uniref:Uncharacterized protein n=1 Tax=Gossypium barbadense TaxID=3634 RepID=A0A2P5Y3B4_GOSBA|nr:hypothetical protein GOBAR_AA10585 [Gossypium barbadense]